MTTPLSSGPWPDLYGVDFSSAPSARKPITVAHGQRLGALLRLQGLSALPSLDSFAQWLAQPGPWVAGFDLPMGLPRELVERLGWPTEWPALMDHYTNLSRAEIRQHFVEFCASRPVGSKFAHRQCDGPAGASPSMKWVNPPVAWMMHAGVPLLRAAGLNLPGLAPTPDHRTGLEAYPGWLARAVLGRRSYKADDRARQTPERLIARKDLVDALEQGRHPLGLRLKLSHAQRDALVADAKGDLLDAVLCLIQVAWACDQPHWGWPPQVDPLEGWILGV